LVLWLVRLFTKKKEKNGPAGPWPGITLIIPAYNEAAVLEEKIKNTLQLRYAGTLQIIVITDGSDDGSHLIAGSFEKLTVLHQPQRRGKPAAINRAMAHAQHQLTVLTDANTFLNNDALVSISAYFNNPAVGAVCGEKRIARNKGEVYGEMVYWRYESLLKKWSSSGGMVMGAAGELFAFRKSLFQTIPEQMILDDFWLSVIILQQHKKMLYAPDAVATEPPSASLREEYRRRTRIAAGAWQWTKEAFSWRRFAKRPGLLFHFFSHRFCRWFITPVCLLLLLITSAYLTLQQAGWFYEWAFYGHLAAYLLALTGMLLTRGNRTPRLLHIPFYFVFIHICLIVGYWRYISGRQSVLWQKAKR
jgi:poly-beta-1,6-N-acetyl-D-glucosamine synthase